MLEQKKIKDVIESSYNIVSDYNKRISASEIYHEISSHFHQNKNNKLKKLIAACLLEIPVKKKRFNDAYYYCGIVRKNNLPSLDEIIKKRAQNVYRDCSFVL